MTMTIDELRQINPEQKEFPGNWSDPGVHDAYVTFRDVLESVLGKVHFDVNVQDCTSIASFAVPEEQYIETPKEKSAGVILSKFNQLFTISTPWLIMPDTLEKLVSELTAAGFNYVPFTLFRKAPTEQRPEPPFEHEEVWVSLFDYV